MKYESLKPTISLTVIALVAALALALANHVTAPKIEARQKQSKAEQRQMVMSEADDFVQIDDLGAANPDGAILEAYTATKGGAAIGYVFNLSSNGFGGPVNVTVGVGSDLTITGLRIGDNSETAGLGSRAANPEFYTQYEGKSGDPALTVNGSGANNIDGLTSATITSTAVTRAAQIAWDAAKLLQEKGA